MSEIMLTEAEKEALRVAIAYAANPAAKPQDIVALYSSMVKEIIHLRKTGDTGASSR